MTDEPRRMPDVLPRLVRLLVQVSLDGLEAGMRYTPRVLWWLMMADCWTCGDAWEWFVPHGCYRWYVPLIVAVILLYAPDGGWLS